MDQGDRAPGQECMEQDEREQLGDQVATVLHMYAMTDLTIERGIKWRCEQLMAIVKQAKHPLNALEYVRDYFNVGFEDWGGE